MQHECRISHPTTCNTKVAAINKPNLPARWFAMVLRLSARWFAMLRLSRWLLCSARCKRGQAAKSQAERCLAARWFAMVLQFSARALLRFARCLASLSCLSTSYVQLCPMVPGSLQTDPVSAFPTIDSDVSKLARADMKVGEFELDFRFSSNRS